MCNCYHSPAQIDTLIHFQQETDGGHLLSLHDFLSDCISPSMHRYCPGPDHHASQFPTSITILHTVLVDNLLSVEDSGRQRLESETGLASVLVGYLEFLALVLEDIQQEGGLSVEGIHVKSKAVEIFEALQESLARNVDQIGKQLTQCPCPQHFYNTIFLLCLIEMLPTHLSWCLLYQLIHLGYGCIKTR
jgi:hypothetical protein